jgi:excinuclease UvrABC ATPase subunit
VIDVLSISLSKKNEYGEVLKYLNELSGSVILMKEIIDNNTSRNAKKGIIQNNLGDIKLKIDNIDLESFKDEIRRAENIEIELKEINTLIKTVNQKNKKLDDTKKEMGKIVDRYSQANTDFISFKNTIGYCPYCDSEIKSS